LSTGKYALPLPERMPPDTLIKRFFAKTYGFTEEMTDESSIDAVTWWPEIEAAEAHAMNKEMPAAPAPSAGMRRR
jgi:hypothetical protein